MSKGSKPCSNCGENRAGCCNSRPYNGDGAMWRRTYECSACGQRFTTLETIVAQRGADFIDTNQAATRAFLADIQAAVRSRFGDGRKSIRHGINRKEAE